MAASAWSLRWMPGCADSPLRWEVYINGGRIPTGLMRWSGVPVCGAGAGEILLTSMDGDGSLAGYDVELTRAVAEAVSVPVIASGGRGQAGALRRGADRPLGGCRACRVRSFTTTVRIGDIKAFLLRRESGAPVERASFGCFPTPSTGWAKVDWWCADHE